MSPHRLRFVMHIGSLVVAATMLAFLPFSPMVNAFIVAVVWLVDGAVTEMVFNRRASIVDKMSDLRDRVDNPPS
jgi:hypothetical protein